MLLMSFGYQISEKMPLPYREQILRKDSILVRLEFYHIAWQVINDQPLFGLGFYAPLAR